MNTTLARICAASAGVFSASALSFVAPAMADTLPDCATPTQMQSGDGNCSVDVLAESYSHDATSGHVTSVNGVRFRSGSGARVLAFIQAHGATRHQMHGKKVTLKHGGTYNTSYFNTAGVEVWHMKYYPAGYSFVKGSDGYMHDPNCWNKVTGLPHGPMHAPKGHIELHGHYKIVKVFRFSTSAKAVLAQNSVSKATAWANGYLYDSQGNLVVDGNGNAVQTCHAEAHATGGASFRAVGKASLKGRIFVSEAAAVNATISGANASLNAKLEGKTHEEVIGETWASARGKATTSASALAICNDTHQPPPNQPPPPAPPSVTMWQKNDVDVNDLAKACADYDVPATNGTNDKATLTFGSGFGSYPTGTTVDGSQSGKTFTVSGQGTVCTAYKAPSEVPPSGHDTLTVTLHDNTSGLSDNTPADNTTDITINPAPTPPL